MPEISYHHGLTPEKFEALTGLPSGERPQDDRHRDVSEFRTVIRSVRGGPDDTYGTFATDWC
jgi:hypothetical protein